MKGKTYHSRKMGTLTWCRCDLRSLWLIKMAQKEHALAKFYKTKFIGSRKTWSAKFPVDVKEEGGGLTLDVKQGTFEYVDGPLQSCSEPLSRWNMSYSTNANEINFHVITAAEFSSSETQGQLVGATGFSRAKVYNKNGRVPFIEKGR